MITLKVDEYCHNCPEFEPSVDRTTMCSDDFFGNPSMVLTETVVTCEHKQRCQSIHAYIVKGAHDD